MFDIKKAIEKLKLVKKPTVLFIEAQKTELLKNHDCLSVDGTIFRNGGNVDGKEALPFIKGTPELIDLLKQIFNGI